MSDDERFEIVVRRPRRDTDDVLIEIDDVLAEALS